MSTINLDWKGPFSPSSCTKQNQQDQIAQEAVSYQVLSISRDEDSSVSLQQPVLVFHHLHGEKFFLISSCNFPGCDFCLLPLILSLQTYKVLLCLLHTHPWSSCRQQCCSTSLPKVWMNPVLEPKQLGGLPPDSLQHIIVFPVCL